MSDRDDYFRDFSVFSLSKNCCIKSTNLFFSYYDVKTFVSIKTQIFVDAIKRKLSFSLLTELKFSFYFEKFIFSMNSATMQQNILNLIFDFIFIRSLN